MEGYIKLYRQVMKWEWYDDANTFRLFIHLLLKANHADGNWRGTAIKRGQRFTSIGILSHELSISEKAIRIAIDKLVKTKEIVCKGASNGTMITVCNYDAYQSNEDTEGQAEGQAKGKRKGKRGANEGRQTIIIKNNKEGIEEEKEVYAQFAHLKIYKFEFDKLVLAGFTKNEIDTVINRIENYSKNSKYVSLYLTALDWLKRDFKKETIEDSEMTHKQLKKHLWDNHIIQIDDINCFTFEQLMDNYKSGKYPKKP